MILYKQEGRYRLCAGRGGGVQPAALHELLGHLKGEEANLLFDFTPKMCVDKTWSHTK